ncbi:unnamed protein product [Effrenium voratum]|nr:unnamed protein product [Effrenium voratum]
MTSLLAKQVASFRQQHGISALGPKRAAAPSVLFTPQEARKHDAEAFAALALRGLYEASLLDPQLAEFSKLFEGPQKDRELLTREGNAALDKQIHQFLLLLSPHLQARASQECLEGLLHRYHVHRWNVDDIMAAVLPHHDSPLFTKLVQGLHVENRPRWSWLSTLKAKPATLVRSTLAKYCSKDTAVLSFVGEIVEESLQLQKGNRALMTFFTAIWLDTLAMATSVSELAQVVIPTLLLLLRQPRQQDAFHAGVTITAALCAKTELEASVQAQLLVRAARQAVGPDGQAAFALMAAMLQLQAISTLPSSVLKVMIKNGPEELLQAMPPNVDAGNLLAMVVEAALMEPDQALELVHGVLDATLDTYAPKLCQAVLQAFVARATGKSAKERKKILKAFEGSLRLAATRAMALREAFGQLEESEAAKLLAPSIPSVEDLPKPKPKPKPKAMATAPKEDSEEEPVVKPKVKAKMSVPVEVPDAAAVQQLLKSSELRSKDQEKRKAAAELICEQVASLQPGPGAVELLGELAETCKEAGKRALKDQDRGAVEPLLLAVAALSEQLAKDFQDGKADVGSMVPAVCEAIDEASQGKSLAPVLRCCGALALVAPAGEPPAPLSTAQKALRLHAKRLRPNLMTLLKGNIRRLWRNPGGDEETWPFLAQVRLRGLLQTVFELVEVNASSCLALAQSSGIRASADFTILLLLVHKARQPQVPPKKRRKTKRRTPEAEEVEEELEALTAPSSEDVAVEEALEVLTSVDPGSRYHAFSMLLLTLSALSSKMIGSELSWSVLLPELEDLGDDERFRVLGQGFSVASRFLSEHGLPDDLDQGEAETAAFMEIAAEGSEDLSGVVAALCHGARALSIAEAALTRSPGGPQQAECRRRASALRGLLMRSLAVNHPLTFFRALCLSLGVKGKAPKNEGLLEDEDFSLHLSSSIMGSAAAALKDRRELRKEGSEGAEAEEDDEGPGAQSAPLCQLVIQHVSKRFLSGDAVPTAWRLLDDICRFSRSHVAGPLVKLLPKAGSFLAQKPDAGVACCQCVETIVTCLGRGMLSKLNDIVPPLLDLAQDADGGALENQVLLVLNALANSVGSFLSPFLGRFLEVVSTPAPLKRTKSLQDLAQQMVSGVPQRLLLQAVQVATVDPFQGGDLDDGLLRTQRLATFFIWILSKATPEFVAAQDSMPSLLRLLGVSSSAVKAFLANGGQPEEITERLRCNASLSPTGSQELSWAKMGSASLPQLHALAAAAFSQYALRLELDELKRRFAKVLDWARGKQERLLRSSGSEEACRALALLAVMTSLATEAPGLAEEQLLPLAAKDVSSALEACHRLARQLVKEKAPKKRKGEGRRQVKVLHTHTWWWYDVACSSADFVARACKPPGGRYTESKSLEDAVEELRDATAALLDLFEFLPEETAGGLLRALQPALVSLAAAAAGDAVKRLMQAVLEKTRSEDAEVRLNAVKCAHRIWSDLGVQVVSCLSEVVMYAAELLDDEDARVESAVRAMVKTIEDCTGESLHEALQT